MKTRYRCGCAMMTPTVIGMRMPNQSLEARLCISSAKACTTTYHVSTNLTHLAPEAMVNASPSSQMILGC